MNPAIQAEIARQVVLALHQEREDRYYASGAEKGAHQGGAADQLPRRRLSFESV
jgi:hypothetical protein